ncbi:uroporphyrinogen-III synthase [Marinicella sp. S1101]|uniref:uroporphyrinogen-III synthase n=1 Tax=Marinicella marina TaxID=2996016 RepID=UPI002260F8E2|nr:uroporphyrinogen-III synthase [Marinicella marina]MCX7552778.1 uroporphyrinogen-III synthase [Marinicella marina]MDJ1139913.1 uroporphyrinogen-III synthase [Marinicella marina]
MPQTTVIITRPAPVIDTTAAVYEAAGFKVFKSPCFDIQTNNSIKPEWLQLKADVWVILSVNALNHALKIAPEWVPPAGTEVIAVGPAVAAAWEKHFNQSINYHPLMNSEGVIELLKNSKPQSVKTISTSGGRDLIRKYCMDQAISFNQINSYIRVSLAIDVAAISVLLEASKQVVLTATSSDILNHFVAQLPTSLKSQVLGMPLLVGAKRIAELACALGFVDIAEAGSPSDLSMSSMI